MTLPKQDDDEFEGDAVPGGGGLEEGEELVEAEGLDPELLAATEGIDPEVLEDFEDVDSDDSDDSGEESEESEDGEESEGEASESEPSPQAKPKSKKDDEDEPGDPDTPIPTRAVMLKALEWAFENEEDITPELLGVFADHAVHLMEANRITNLTAIHDPKEVAAKHYLDSWRVSRLIPLVARRIVDLGSGGGFPGLPIAAYETMCSMVLCESKKKKAAFLEESVRKLGLRNVSVTSERCEEFLAKERCDLVLVRAVSSVRENIRTLRKVRHSLKDFVMLKGNSWSREVRAAEREAERLGFKLDTVFEHELPEEMGKRAILIYRAPGGAGM